MQATKETAVIAFGAMAIALGLAWLWSWLVDGNSGGAGPSKGDRQAGRQPSLLLEARPPTAVHIVVAFAVAAFVALFLLSTFFTNPQGLVDSVGAYLPWLRRAGGQSVHTHPWYFYWERLLAFHRTEIPGLGKRAPFWSEGWILVLATIGLIVSLWRGGHGVPDGSARLVRFLGFYAIVTATAYSVVPYKTPWCLLNFWFPTILLAGVGAVAAIRWIRWAPAATGAVLLIVSIFTPAIMTTVLVFAACGLMIVAALALFAPPIVPRLAMAAALLAALAHLGWQAYRASYVFPAEPCNPYVYAHTTPNMLKLHEKLEELAAASPQGHETPIQVITQDNYYWPLPWYLRKFDRPRITYYSQIPDNLGAPIVIVAPEYCATVEARLKETHQRTSFYTLRPQVFLVLFVRKDIWQAHVPPG
jgi:predicted membrane-bound mannosyltransferase